MKKQLVALLELQKADALVRKLEKAVSDLPLAVEPRRRDLERLRGMLTAELSKHNEAQAWQKEAMATLEREQDLFKHAKAKLSASQSGKEFHAANREVDTRRKTISDREVELKKMGGAIEGQAQALAERQRDVDALAAQLATAEAELGEKALELKAEIVTATQARDAARDALPVDVRKAYDALTSRRAGAVAEVLSGTCQGCHMALPPQLNNILARGETMEVCPGCKRWLYRREYLEGTPAQV